MTRGFLITVSLATLPLVAQEPQPAKPPDAPVRAQDAKSAPVQQPPAKPTPEHKHLQLFAGDWDVMVTVKGPENGKDEVRRAVEHSRVVCGGYWLLTDVLGQEGGQPFQRRALLGYEPASKTFRGVWIDSTSPVAKQSVAVFDPETRMLSSNTEVATPNGRVPARAMTSFRGADQRTEKVWIKDKDGKESLYMEISSVRRRADPTEPAIAVAPASLKLKNPARTPVHEQLAAFAGTFSATVEHTQVDGGTAKEEARQTDQAVCDDLWLVQRVQGQRMGAPFEAHTLIGYDPDRREVQAFWIDSLSPQLRQGRGTVAKDGKELTLESSWVSADGMPMHSLETVRITREGRVSTIRCTKDGKDAGTTTIRYERVQDPR